jgi:hypothetical protein
VAASSKEKLEAIDLFICSAGILPATNHQMQVFSKTCFVFNSSMELSMADASNYTGDASNYTGDASNYTGDASNYTGDASNYTGDASNYTGDASKMLALRDIIKMFPIKRDILQE